MGHQPGNNVVDEQFYTGDKVHIYSRSKKKWTVGSIINKYKHGWLKVEYTIDSIAYEKEIQVPNHLLIGMHNKPKLMVIFVKSQGDADILMQELINEGYNKEKIRVWTSTTADDIKHDVNQFKVNVIMVGCCFTWSPTRWDTNWMINNVDYIVKYEWKLKSIYYNYFKQMLKATGYLIKFTRNIMNRNPSCDEVLDMLFHFDDWIEKRYKYVLVKDIVIPTELKEIIFNYSKYDYSDFVSQTLQNEL